MLKDTSTARILEDCAEQSRRKKQHSMHHEESIPKNNHLDKIYRVYERNMQIETDKRAGGRVTHN